MNLPPREYWNPQKSEGYYTSCLDQYPGIEAALAGLKRRNPECVEPVIRFLEEDPYALGTGYLKEEAWKRLGRVPLTGEQKARLRRVALGYVEERLCREFFPMCRFVAGITDDSFKGEVAGLTLSGDPMIGRRALLLQAYFEGIPRGNVIA